MKKSISPRLRFKSFNLDWEHKPLYELLKVKSLRNSSNKFSRNDVLSVSGDMGIVNQMDHLGRSYAGKNLDNYHVVDVGDIVYTKSPLKDNPYGIIKANNYKSGIVSTLYAVYETKAGCNYNFINRYFELDDRTNKYLRPLVNKGAKNDMKINNDRVLEGSISIPGPEEQKYISDYFDVIDNWLFNIKVKIENLEKYKKKTIRNLFSRKLRFKKLTGEDYSNWNVDIFSNIAEKSDKKHDPKKQITNFRCVELESLSSNSGLLLETFDSTKLDSTKNIFTKKSVLFGKLRPYLRKYYYADFDGVCSSEIWVLNGTKITNEFLYYLIQTDRFIASANVSTGSKMPRADWDYISNISFEYPEIDEQNRITDFLFTIDELIHNSLKEFDSAQKFKKSMLQLTIL